MVAERILGGRVLTQGELAALNVRYRAGTPTTITQQLNLRATFLSGVAANRPAGIAPLPYNVGNPNAQAWMLNQGLLSAYNCGTYRGTFAKLAPRATAGLRDNYDVLDFNNPNYMYNGIFIPMILASEARFLHDMHREKAARLGAMDLGTEAAKIERLLSPTTLDGISQIFQGRNVRETLELLRERPLKIMNREVRPQTDLMLELEARMMAAQGITVVAPERFSDTSNIYLTSFLCYLLGADGGTFYTPSHSSVYVLGRKALGPNGAQLYPEVYQGFIDHLGQIYDQAEAGGFQMRMSERDNPLILNTLADDVVARLFAEALSPNPDSIAAVNLASQNGLRVVLNTLNGSAARGLRAQMAAFGVDARVFQPLLAEEDPYFRVGYTVARDGDRYFADHLGVDTTAPKIVRQIPYAQMLKGEAVGTLVYECDPDNDRFVVKQILPESSRGLCEAFGIDVYPLSGGNILAAPSPNKMFLLLDIADYERMKSTGEWDANHFLYFPTYVSSAAWVEFSTNIAFSEGNLDTFLSRVGFKNLNGVLGEIQDWYFGRPNEAEFTITPQIGGPVTLTRRRPIRVLSKEEESGGRVGGYPKTVYNILGEPSLSLPEKAVGDAALNHLINTAVRFNDGETTDQTQIIAQAFEKYGLVSCVDYRLDVLHGDQGIIAQVGPTEAQALKDRAGAEKTNFNNFFFSIADAIRKGTLTLDEAKALLTRVLPQWAETWKCLDAIVYVTEEVLGEEGPEGVQMIFSKKDGVTPLVTQFKFRPSGTDPLKSKVYLDAKAISPARIKEVETAFDTLKGHDLYSVLDQAGIEPVMERPALLGQIGLTPIQ